MAEKSTSRWHISYAEFKAMSLLEQLRYLRSLQPPGRGPAERRSGQRNAKVA